MLPNLVHSLATINAPAALPAWLQCVAGLPALHSAVALGQQQQHNSSTSSVKACLSSDHSLCQGHRYAPVCPAAALHKHSRQQDYWQVAVADGCSAKNMQPCHGQKRMFASKPAQNEGQQQHSPWDPQQQQQQQQPQVPKDDESEASLGLLQSHFRKLRSQQPATARPSLEQELGRLQQQHEQHLLSVVSHQQQQHQRQDQRHGRAMLLRQQQLERQLQQQEQQLAHVQQQPAEGGADVCRMWREELQQGAELLQQQHNQQTQQQQRTQQQQGDEWSSMHQHQHQHQQQQHQQHHRQHRGSEGGPGLAQQGRGEERFSFQQLGVDRVLLQSLSSLAITQPTPVQVNSTHSQHGTAWHGMIANAVFPPAYPLPTHIMHVIPRAASYQHAFHQGWLLVLGLCCSAQSTADVCTDSPLT